MDKEKKWCVYVHTSPSNKYYVGITCQRPEARWRNGRGYSYNTYFTRAINKYGWDNFQHEVVATDLLEQEAKDLEKYLIKKLKSNNEQYGYNLTEGGDGTCGVSRYGEQNPFYGKKHTEETKTLMRQNHKDMSGENNSFYGKHHNEKSKQKIREAQGMPVCQFDLDLNFIREYPSAKLASEITGIFHSMILGCCNQLVGYKTAGGYVWIFKSDIPNINFDEYRKRLQHEKLPKPVCQFSLSMEFIAEYDSIGQASKVTGIRSSNISLAASGKQKQASGYIWIFKEDLENMSFEEIKIWKAYKKPCCRAVYKFSLDMILIEEYESRADAAKSIGITPQAIGYACNSETHESHGYLWWFKDDYEKEVA